MTPDDDIETLPSRRLAKSDTAFRTISEVSEDLDVPQHVLRFWEGKFTQIKPLKRGGGRRYYRPEDMALLRRIRDLLYREGYTIRGVQKLLRESPTALDLVNAEALPSAIVVDMDAGADDPEIDAEIDDAALEPQAEADATKHEMLTAIRDELVLLRELIAKGRA